MDEGSRRVPGAASGPPGTGRVYVALRPRFGPKHSVPAQPARCITWRQRGHRSWNAGITRSPAQGPVRATTSSDSSSRVRNLPSSASPIAATTWPACSSVSRTPGGNGLGPVGTAVKAAEKRGSSRAARRWTVPRGPYVLIRDRSSQRAARTSARVTPSARIPTDTSAAESTCACAPSIAPTTSATGVPVPAGPARNCRSARRALAASHVIFTVVVMVRR